MEGNVEQPRVTRIEALLIILGILFIIGISLIVFAADPHIPIFLALLLLIGYSMIKKVNWKVTEKGIIQGVASGIIPILIFMFIGVLISVWVSAGTIPTLIYYSFHLISMEWFLPSVFVATAVIGICIGSSFTTASTIGVSFMALGGMLELDPAMTAGAVVSGALVGDKMSPLSDTTNLAASVSKVDLFEHIRHLLWTTVPLFVIAFIFYTIIGQSPVEADMQTINVLMNDLHESFLVHPATLLPAAVIVILAVRRVSAIPSMAAGIVMGIVVTMFVQPDYSVGDYMTFMQDGFVLESGNDQLDEMLSRGGIQDMMWSVSLLILTLSMGGVLSELGIIEKLLEALSSMVKTTGRLVLSTALTGIGINISLGEQYMSVILTGEAFEQRYEQMGIKRKNLSRVLENAGTLINPLIPYGVSGVFMASVLGVDVLQYLPYALFCLLGPAIVILYGFAGFQIDEKK
ncbi:putative tyrosine permease, NhaC family [Alteribacillus persepolensis]|uniref:Putative tyrosine permease, NhaC family n=1 Tax=Alteribacillus persepolensis TaxID=568899 RepID=A0A1G8C668_9BACI|nr:Na+/H+ antiporter NhaC [Alteribacillus persepolensis]SDH41027.1 putative tyrosine permease, NhaC family [Alteribacillus persepolensis]